MSKLVTFLLWSVAASCLAYQPGPGYKLAKQITPDKQREFFGGPHIDTVIEIYRKEGEEKDAGTAFKIVLSSLGDPSRKELLFEYDRQATVDLSPDGKWIILNDRPFRGECNPRLFKQQAGLKFTEIKNANIRKKAIKLFLRENKCRKSIGEHMLPEGSCIVESLFWSDDSKSLLLYLSKGQTGEPLWINHWYCIYDLASGEASLDLNVLNRAAIQPGKYLAPAR